MVASVIALVGGRRAVAIVSSLAWPVELLAVAGLEPLFSAREAGSIADLALFDLQQPWRYSFAIGCGDVLLPKPLVELFHAASHAFHFAASCAPHPGPGACLHGFTARKSPFAAGTGRVDLRLAGDSALERDQGGRRQACDGASASLCLAARVLTYSFARGHLGESRFPDTSLASADPGGRGREPEPRLQELLPAALGVLAYLFDRSHPGGSALHRRGQRGPRRTLDAGRE